MEDFKMNYSERLNKVIPGGAHTYSRGDDQYPSNAPQILSKGEGAYVWGADGNKFLDFGHESIVSKESGDSIVMAESKVDYAIILKISPFGNPKRTWLCCSGFGEWGTSGAAWWLSHNWKSIYKKAKNRSFACITRTRVGSDDSTRMLHLFLSSEDVL